MSFRDFSLNPKNFKDLPLNKYATDFTFIVDNKPYSTSRFVADILSPTIRKNHYNDESNCKFIINTSPHNNKEQQKDEQGIDYFSEFLQIATLNEIKLDSKRQELYSEYFIQLWNLEEFCRTNTVKQNPSEFYGKFLYRFH